MPVAWIKKLEDLSVRIYLSIRKWGKIKAIIIGAVLLAFFLIDIEVRQWGIVFTIIGAVLLAYSLEIEPGYDDKDHELKEVHQQAEKKEMYRPSKDHIVPWRFKGGLGFVAVGSFLQW
jgi:hypothetical protein